MELEEGVGGVRVDEKLGDRWEKLVVGKGVNE